MKLLFEICSVKADLLGLRCSLANDTAHLMERICAAGFPGNQRFLHTKGKPIFRKIALGIPLVCLARRFFALENLHGVDRFWGLF